MPNISKDDFFQQLIKGLDKTIQATLLAMYRKSVLAEELIFRAEIDKLKKEIVDEVLESIRASADMKQILSQIDELNQAIDKLGK